MQKREARHAALAKMAAAHRRRHRPKTTGKPKLGSGGRFAMLKNELADRPGVTDPAALAAAIGRKKYGARKMAAMAAAGRRRG